MPEQDLVGQAEREQPAKNRRWILIVVGVVVLLVVVVAASWATGILDGLGADADTRKEAPRTVNQVIAFEPVVVNLTSPGRMNYARIGVSLGVHNPSPGQPVMDEDLVVPKVRDRLLSLVGGMDSRQLLQTETKEEIKREVLSFANEMIGGGPAQVIEVYFTDFIIQ